MCPFLDDDYEDEYSDSVNDLPANGREGETRANFFQDEKKFLVIGGVAAIVAFCVTGYVVYFNSKPVDIDDLPVISADASPVKVKPEKNEQVKHLDKTVYDNISGDSRPVVEKVVAQPEDIISIPTIDGDEILSDEEKNSIIQAFDELAPEKQYKINYVNSSQDTKPTIQTEQFTIVETEENPPVKIVKEEARKPKKPVVKSKKKTRLKEIINSADTTRDIKLSTNTESGLFMVQVASVASKAAAEVEYNRIVRKNPFLKQRGKKIVRVDLGKDKGVKFRIQIGPFKTKAAAQKVVTDLHNNGCAAYISR